MNTENNMEKRIPGWLVLFLAAACGLIVANLYYAQPLVGPISSSTGISSDMAGFIVTMTQLGYAAGLLLLVPLSDLLENRKLVVTILAVALLGLLGAGTAANSAIFFAAAVLIGLGSAAAQILVPLAAHMAPPEQRGSIVGNVMSGLLLGIMLARPASSLITDLINWRAVFIISAVIITLLVLLLRLFLPKRVPVANEKYTEILKSLFVLFKSKPVLRRRAFYQAALFGSFSLFWTVVPLWLSKNYGLSQREIAVFGFVGVAGAIAAPIAGRLADRGLSRKLTGAAFLIAAFAFAFTHVLENGNHMVSLVIFCISAVLLDMSVSGNLVLGQQEVYALGDEIRGRVNGIFMAVFFLGGALGSALGGWAYAQGSWKLASIIGLVLPVIGFIYYLTESKKRNREKNIK
jgi:predicted MFS family arabinose efflux permease